LPGCSEKLYRALDRAGDRVHSRMFYESLGELASGRFGDALLRGGTLSESRLRYFEVLSAMDPLVASLQRALPESRHTIEAIDSLLAYLRTQNALSEGDFHLPRKSGLTAIVRRLRQSLGPLERPTPVSRLRLLSDLSRQVRSCSVLESASGTVSLCQVGRQPSTTSG
jgi:hypothetical protein